MQMLGIYSSKERQCKLGYDSSSSCDSFQLGEMVKFLTKRNLLHLVPLQAYSPEDAEYVWPEAYTGDIENLIGVLRQCPSYQIDSNHKHCGLRIKLLPALDYIKSCIDSGAGIRLTTSKIGNNTSHESWIINKPSEKKSFWVGSQDVTEPKRTFELAKARNGSFGDLEERVMAKSLFTADGWNWLLDQTPEDLVVWRRPTYSAM